MSNQIDVTDDRFGAILNCAVRYCLGRKTYMPSLVIDYIIPLIPHLSNNTLFVFQRDVSDAESFGGYGDDRLDKPAWMYFLDAINKELSERESK